MQLTITSGDQLSTVEVSDDIELENFLALCLMEMSLLSGASADSLVLLCNGNILDPKANDNLKKQLKLFGVKNGDLVQIERRSPAANSAPPPVAATARTTPTAVASGSKGPVDIAAMVAGLAKSIKVPKKRAAEEEQSREYARNIHSMMTDPSRRETLRSFAPLLIQTYEADTANFEAFYEAFMKHKQEEEKKVRLMHDETSVEGQRLLAEHIERQNIEFNHQFALEHTPEAFVSVHMLYIRMKINGCDILAFVDSGAQVSILSESCARRCNVMRLCDNRYRATALGVGGSAKFAGRIHSCQVQVEGHVFPCSFDVMSGQSVDILFGLNILRRHRCAIDLNKNVLRFGDGTETPFVEEEEYKRLKEVEATMHGESETAQVRTVEADSEKLAHLLSLGFEEETARAELIRCHNDLETAANNLSSKMEE